MSRPDVSVVMSVYNGAPSLAKTIASITSQTGVEFEFIVVNDGSSDESLNILQSLQEKDSRLILIDQVNRGLTNALIVGCHKARGKFIARQDCGDISFAERLKTQIEYLEAHNNVSMVSSATRFTTPSGEEIYTVTQTLDEAERCLRREDALSLAGPPHHGSVMFRREDYLKVGGYRAEFVVAQDIDLWSRLTELGLHHSLQPVFYQAVLAKNSISMLQRDQQLNATRAIIACMKSRKLKGNDSSVLKDYAESSVSQRIKPTPNNKTDSAYYYFLGSNLYTKNLEASLRYLNLSLDSNPWHWKARTKLFAGFVRNFFNGIPKK